MKRCVIYHRVSSYQQYNEGSGLLRQAELIEDYLKRTNLCAEMDDPEPVIITEARGTSAFKGHNMELTAGMGAWMAEVRANMWNDSHLIVESTDRWSRQNPFTVIEYITNLVKHNISIHDVKMNIVINRENSALLPMVLINAERAFMESKYKSDRIRDGWKRKRENAFNNGTIVTQKRPKWIDVIDNKYVLNDKAKIVEEIFRLYQTGLGCPTIAKVLQDKGDAWQFDRPWRGEAVHKVLRNRRVTGVIFISEIIRDYTKTNNSDDGEAKSSVHQKRYEMEVYPPIIGKDEFELVQKILKSRRLGSGRTNGGIVTKKLLDEKGKPVLNDENKVIYVSVDSGKEIAKSNIFSGIFRCARCGEPMYHNVVVSKRNPVKSEPRIEEYRYIRCLGERDNLCENKALRYEIVERFVIEHIKGLDFAKIIKASEVNPELELIKLNIQEERKHIQEYEHGIERLRNSGKKIPFDVLVELEDSQNKLKELTERLSMMEEVHVDIDALKNVDPSLLYDVQNIEIRSKIERELTKVLNGIQLYRNGKSYIITINYRNVEQLKHVLMVEAKKEPVLVSDVNIERIGNTVIYSTPSFALSVEDGTMPRIHFLEDEHLSAVDYAMLLNYIDSVEGADAAAIWMRHNQNFLFS